MLAWGGRFTPQRQDNAQKNLIRFHICSFAQHSAVWARSYSARKLRCIQRLLCTSANPWLLLPLHTDGNATTTADGVLVSHACSPHVPNTEP